MRSLAPLVVVAAISAGCVVGAASRMPALKADRWVNSAPLTPETLRGQVVLVDVWEYTCINWIRTASYVKAWHRDYASLGLVVIGVHSPEFEFGKAGENVDRGIRDHGLTYPIAIDNQFAIWRALGNDAWPAKYLYDRQGKLVKRWIGEGSYDDIETEIRRLLATGSPDVRLPAVSQEVARFAATGEPSYAGITSETYVGSERRQPGAVDLEGDWRTEPQYVELRKGTGTIAKPVGAVRGEDVGADGVARFDRSGMLRLVAGATRGRQVLTLVTSDVGVKAFAFTFGP